MDPQILICWYLVPPIFYLQSQEGPRSQAVETGQQKVTISHRTKVKKIYQKYL